MTNERPKPMWQGAERWALATERGIRLDRVETEPWEDERTWYVRHHLTTWCESLRVGLLTVDEAFESIEMLKAELRARPSTKTGFSQESCPRSPTGLHCECWYECEPCHYCLDDTRGDGCEDYPVVTRTEPGPCPNEGHVL